MDFSQVIQLEQYTKAAQFNPEKNCLFTTGTHCLVSQGVRKRITLPINDTAQLVANITANMRDLPDDTIAFAALPFCKTEQAQVIIPEKVSRWDKAAFNAWFDAELAPVHGQKNHLSAITDIQSQAQFEQAVVQAKQLFDSEQLDKIVLSKQTQLDFEQPINHHLVLRNLLQQSQSGYHFSFPTLDGATLMGVSPELLLKKQAEALTTNPLAGSIPRDPCPKEEAHRRSVLFASKKDRYEHAVVIEDIQQVLSPFCSKLKIPAQPELLSTATMWHLSTVISGALQHPETHSLMIANQLHPTPALCGKPTSVAYPKIAELEQHSRGLFSGIIGWFDKQGNGEWVVVIRCAQLYKHTATLFAGAGIVAASDPRSEWLETEAKLNTMLNALEIKQTYYAMRNKLHEAN
ncbi:isochorismate synthase [Pseudoalteromonas peptidolytica]|uniref:isochorismate synthase n=1 Tax=Pseudoalteromonas peptidolytica F12-50-A1 TaxID=1315280 RepID=A0A8I0T7B5_9GAMM|nr:isochorismate synthase [Pseudoalteromonas peptidolytica]MBE0348049.1 isochorismate synthase [Pseudoalteromonas peptidolytica F12-50-A1]NLR15651.1 isochorismate synthase [Pseudoalteromonas peptidolytica]GEK10959.1 isochorismate synthase EntC [Pseudoalteromonas peptidolytica]